MLVYLFLRYYSYSDVSPQWFFMPLTVGQYSVWYVGLTWLLLVLPLFLFVHPASVFWRPWVCIPLFAVAGLLIMAGRSGFNSAYPFSLLWLLAAICGGATGFFSALVQRHLTSKTKRAEQAMGGDALQRPS